MAATSYSTLPSSSYIGHGSQGDSYHSNNFGTYEAGIGSITSHPYQHQPTTYDVNPMDNHQQSLYSNDYQQSTFLTADHEPEQQHLNGYSNLNTPRDNDKKQAKNNTRNQPRTKPTRAPPPQKKPVNNRQAESKNQQQNIHIGTTQNHPPAPVDNHHRHSQPNLVRSERQISNPPSKKQKQHKSQPSSQSNLNRSDQQISKSRASSPQSVRHRSLSNSRSRDNHISETTPKPVNPSKELKPTKSSVMRAAAIKKKEETLERKRKDKYFPQKLKSQQTSPQTDAEQSDIEKTKSNTKQPQSLPKIQKSSHSDGEQTDTGKSKHQKKKSRSQSKQRKSRRDGYQTDDKNNDSSGDEDNHKRQRSKSQKRTTFSDSHLDKHSQLPPVRRHRMPPFYDPYLDYPLPPGHPLRGRFPYHDDYIPYGPYHGRYDHRHLYEDADHIPPYLAPYHDPYDPFFDYEKRKVKPKQHKDKNDPHTDHEDNNGYETERDEGAKSQLSRKSKHKNTTNNENGGRKSHRDHEENRRWPPGYYHHPPYYDGTDMLEIWRQERNDYLKKKFKPTIHDVLYAQQWMKSDSYLENQRRRALRDVQGYYFPYKKYTLKDYKDMQRLNNQNPFADSNEITIDRKERAKKRQEYGALVERQMVDNPGARHVPAREMPPRKPWHLSNGDQSHDPDRASKRDRALEYAKIQVKYRPVDSTKNSSHKSDRTEQDKINDDDNEPPRETYQSYDDYD